MSVNNTFSIFISLIVRQCFLVYDPIPAAPVSTMFPCVLPSMEKETNKKASSTFPFIYIIITKLLKESFTFTFIF